MPFVQFVAQIKQMLWLWVVDMEVYVISVLLRFGVIKMNVLYVGKLLLKFIK